MCINKGNQYVTKERIIWIINVFLEISKGDNQSNYKTFEVYFQNLEKYI